MKIRILNIATSAALLAMAVCSTPAPAAAKSTLHWYASWTASPVTISTFPPSILAPLHDAVTNQTVRQTITLSHGGLQLRVRFSNEFSTAPLHIGAASVGYASPSGVIRVPLTFGGAKSVSVQLGAPIISDPVTLTVPDRADIEISFYLPDRTPVSTVHLLGLQSSLVSQPGNFVMAETLPGATTLGFDDKINHQTIASRFAISEVDVAGTKPIRTVVAFGDSITDGANSTKDTNRRWPDFLAQRITSAKLNLAVVNQGIGGNQVLANGMGDSALARFDRDVLALPGAGTVVLLEGINDIGLSQNFLPPNVDPALMRSITRRDLIAPEEIIQGYRQLIDRAHARGLRVIGATMMPFEGAPSYTPEKETVRQAVNVWIRTSGAFDAVIDFDAVTKDPQKPSRLLERYDSGDHIHPNDAGYEAMAAAVDLKQL